MTKYFLVRDVEDLDTYRLYTKTTNNICFLVAVLFTDFVEDMLDDHHLFFKLKDEGRLDIEIKFTERL